MIIWGSSTKKIGIKKITGVCSHCKSTDLILVGLQRVFDLFWIPVFPIKKFIYVLCNSCDSTFPPESYTTGMHSNDVTFRTPWWSFSGLVIIAMLMLFVSSIEDNTEKKKAEFLANPTQGTYFTFKTKDSINKETPYFIAKVEQVSDDKIVLRFSNYAYSKDRMAVKSIKTHRESSDEDFSSEKIPFTKNEFAKLDLQTIVK